MPRRGLGAAPSLAACESRPLREAPPLQSLSGLRCSQEPWWADGGRWAACRLTSLFIKTTPCWCRSQSSAHRCQPWGGRGEGCSKMLVRFC